ncbi:MAG: signal peptidase I [Coriobacteriia bacterium]|nr:signal peptidase I [Coriobacteriia bacterium]
MSLEFMREGNASDRRAVWLVFPLSILLVAIISWFSVLHTTAVVDGKSMFPTLHDRDYLLITQGYSRPVRGDVIAFRASAASADARNEVVKRVVAVPGDTVEVRSGAAIINGLPERGSHSLELSAGDVSSKEITVPEGTLFVLGDNRPDSVDSRFFGPVPLDLVVGKAVAVFAPVNRIGWID